MNFYVATHALITKKNKILILKRSAVNDYMPHKWDIPGGTVKTGETPYEALKREIMEETSLQVQIKNIIYIYTNCDQLPHRQTFQIIFDCDYINGEIVLNPEEHSEYKWVDLSEARSYDLIAFLSAYIQTKNMKI